jgi:small subunit ribosomal protein S8
MARKTSVSMPTSKVKEAIAEVLVANKYVAEIKKEDHPVQPVLVLTLSYNGKSPALTDLKRISKPGRRLYTNVENIPRTLGGYGVTIISTSQGVMSDKDAKKKNIGGEILCQIW